MTETTSPTHLGPPDLEPPVDVETGALAVGVPVPGARVKIVDVLSRREVGVCEVGEIVVAGPMVIPGYWQREEETAEVMADGWLATGDLGKVTDEDWLFVVDRLKDVINASGYKVYPRDVEDVLLTHPAVREACVVGVPHEYRGETVVAYVSLIGGASVAPDELVDFCRHRVAAYKYPREIHIVDDLPKNPAGKILRRNIRDIVRATDRLGEPK
jgi:long-chain acyl-CoA synthetase